jgi:hypothetical protein
MISDKAKLYFCASETCRKRFVHLSELVAHWESGVCGYTSLWRIQELFFEIIDESKPLPDLRVLKQRGNGGYGSAPPPPAPARDGGRPIDADDAFSWQITQP